MVSLLVSLCFTLFLGSATEQSLERVRVEHFGFMVSL